jgi:hypothetical protein
MDMVDDRQDSTNEADDQGTSEESDEQRAAALRSRVDKVQGSVDSATGDDIIIK